MFDNVLVQCWSRSVDRVPEAIFEANQNYPPSSMRQNKTWNFLTKKKQTNNKDNFNNIL